MERGMERELGDTREMIEGQRRSALNREIRELTLKHHN